MNNLIKYGLIAAVLAGVYFFGGSDDNNYVEDDIDLNLVLDVTVDTLYAYQDSLGEQENLDPDETFLGLADSLTVSYNNSQPPIYEGNIAVSPRADASLLAFVDTNGNQEIDDSEDALFLIEIDGEKARIIASSRSGAVNTHSFSGTSLLAGYMIGSLLSRQKAAGVNTKSLASKQPVTASSAAKARAGSGSHSKGK